jgi:dTDP-4-dehydrorhamnose 3,5-epimerase
MLFHATQLPGAFLVEAQKFEDERGYFARIWDPVEFAAQGLDAGLVQVNLSHNRLRGTLRGLHFQYPPHAECKLVRCMRGSLYDVIVDLRPHSPTFLRSQGFELSRHNLLALYVPKGFAHGFQTLEDDTLVHYHMSDRYEPMAAGGLRWNDPVLGIDWPLTFSVIAERDASYPDLDVSQSPLDRFAALSNGQYGGSTNEA